MEDLEITEVVVKRKSDEAEVEVKEEPKRGGGGGAAEAVRLEVGK